MLAETVDGHDLDVLQVRDGSLSEAGGQMGV